MGLNNVTLLANLDARAVITNYSKKLQRKAIARDFYTNITGDDIIYQHKDAISVPDMFYNKVEASSLSGANNVRLVMKEHINANPLRGKTTALGTEVAPVLKASTIYRANYRFVVEAEPGYHEDKLDAAPWSLYQTHVKDLTPHASAYEGLEIRMGILETNGWSLQAGTTAALCPARWNPNFYVIGPGLGVNNQPAYHSNNNTYTNRIVAAINTASGGNGAFAQSAAQMLTGNELENIARWALRKRLKPMMIDGRSAWVLSVSPLGAQRFTDPFFADSLGNRWTTGGQMTNTKIQDWYGVIGEYRSSICSIYIVIDERLPTLLCGGTGEPFSLTAGYVWPTDNDLRNLDNPLVRDAMILHGKAGLIKWEPEPLHLIQQDWDYELINGKGYAGVRGIQLHQYDVQTTNSLFTGGTAHEHWGSAIIVGGRAEPQ